MDFESGTDGRESLYTFVVYELQYMRTHKVKHLFGFQVGIELQ
jgi:hypothetical protein